MSTETVEPTAASRWRAVAHTESGFIFDDPEEAIREAFADETDAVISIRRGSALPSDDDDGLPGSYASADVFFEDDLSDLDDETEAFEVWELAQKAAWGMNQPAEDRVCGVTQRVSPDSTGRYICVLDPGHEGDHSSCPGDDGSSWPAAAVVALVSPEPAEEWPEELLNARIKFWQCPDRHPDRRDDKGWPTQTVEWRGDVAYCLEPGCGKTSAPEPAKEINK